MTRKSITAGRSACGAIDYARAGAYFVTIVVQDRVCLFGEVVDDEVRLSAGVTER